MTVEDIHSLIDRHKPEPLHRDLVRYLQEDAVLGTMLRHPLIYSVPHHPLFNGLINAQYRAKKKYVAEKVRAKDWASVVTMYEKPYRLDAMKKYGPRMKDAEFWKILGFCLLSVEFPHLQHDLIRFLVSRKRPHRHAMMAREDWRALLRLRERGTEITVYRGTKQRNYADPVPDWGWSWSTSRAVAMKFAVRFGNNSPSERGVILTGRVAPDDILALFNDRGEREVVPVDPERVRVTSRFVVPRTGPDRVRMAG